ncbi:MAG: DUF3426 domain-containing protein [Methylotenera sp.]|nr:DUF3426 domain-containing protein [Methylotenera sp.]
MSAITNCPACQTQFVVTEEQLNQHNGKVRCGHCLHVFNAKDELVESITESETNSEITDDDVTTEIIVQPETLILDSDADDIVSRALSKDSQDSYFNAENNEIKSTSAAVAWLMGLFALTLLLAAIAQSIYFFRTELAVYYPKTKNSLVQACEKIGCTIDLPKKIDLIVIDDSDMQEDANYVGLIHLSSTLINQANFNQAYPNIELTLTDIDDIPKLRRKFKPNEYLPSTVDIAKGLTPGEEVKVKLAITAQGTAVAGYRVFVSY